MKAQRSGSAPPSPPPSPLADHHDHSLAIWGLAFGYFAAYVPYSALTKALSKGLLPGMEGPITGYALLPVATLASMIGMFVFLTAAGWWRFATHRTIGGVRLPTPTRWTLLSGLCTATIVATTTLAYTFKGVSIVFVMLLMRGGLLVIAPIVDALARRTVRWFSWAGLLLSLGALVVAFTEKGGYEVSLVCILDISAYLAAYFVRLRFMSRIAKSPDGDANRRYFVEEQMVATPAVMAALILGAVVGQDAIALEVRHGFTDIWTSGALVPAILVGILSQGTGVFGGLILLDKRENTFCVPVNRSSSILAGVLASFSLAWFLGQRAPSSGELVGAGLIITAILFLTVPPMLERRARRIDALAVTSRAA